MSAWTIIGLVLVVPPALWLAVKAYRWTNAKTTDLLDRWWPK